MTKRFVSFDFLYIIMILSLVLFVAGALVGIERKENTKSSLTSLYGLGSGFCVSDHDHRGLQINRRELGRTSGQSDLDVYLCHHYFELHQQVSLRR